MEYKRKLGNTFDGSIETGGYENKAPSSIGGDGSPASSSRGGFSESGMYDLI